MSNPNVDKAIELAGGAGRIAERLGFKTPWAVNKWKNSFPPERALWLAEATDWQITPHQLAPSLYPNRDDALPVHLRSVTKQQRARA